MTRSPFFKSFFLVAALWSTSASADELSFDATGLDRVLQSYVDDKRLAGSVVLITREGETVYAQAKGWRDIERGIPMTRDTVFRIASQTKAIVSVGIMMLVEEGALALSDPLAAYLPEWDKTTVAIPREDGGFDVVPATRHITIEDLLKHTAGIGYGIGPAAEEWNAAGIQGWYLVGRSEPVRETVRQMARLPMDRQPGETFVYGYSTDILGVVIEEVSGQPLDRFLAERILNPLGMNDTSFFATDSQIARLATVYSWIEDGLQVAPNPGTVENGWHIGQGHYISGPKVALSGGAGLLSTADDYTRFMLMLLNGGELDGARILAPETVALMTSAGIGQDGWEDAGRTQGLNFGLGFQITTDADATERADATGEFGWGGAYNSVYWIDPASQTTVVYLTQLLPTGGLDDQPAVREAIYDLMMGQE